MSISQLLEALKNDPTSLSLSEKLIAGFTVAILSMIVVYIVLSTIAWIISLLQKEKSTTNTKNIKKEENYTKDEYTFTQEEDMGELVSVITAAICSFTGNSSNNIVVKKITRSNNSKSSWESMKKN